MSVSAVGAAAAQYSTKPASDGDSPAIEASESGATVKAEKLNGGSAPNSASTIAPTSQSASGFSILA